MKNRKLMKKVVSFCEEVNALVKKIDEAKDLVEEIKETTEEEGKDANFSVKMKTKLRKLNKQFSDSDLIDDLDEIKVDADELSEDENFSKNKSFQSIKRAIKRFSEDILELKGDISKASAAAASEVNPPEERTPIAPGPSADSSADTTGDVVPTVAVNEGSEETSDSTGTIIEPEPINFSKVRKMHVQKVFSDFDSICEHCEDITDGIEDFTEDMIGTEDNTIEDKTVEDTINETVPTMEDTVVEETTEFCDDAVTSDDLKKLEDKVEDLMTEVNDVMVKEGFAKDEKAEVINKFKDFCGKLDDMVKDEASLDDVAESLESVEFACKNLSKRVKKFSSKKSFCGIMKAFDELPEMVDAIEVSISPVGTEDKADDTFEKLDSEINAKIDKIEDIEKKVTDENLVAFSKMIRKALKAMKCFSEEDVESKSEQVNELIAKLDEAKDKVEEVKEETAEEKTEQVNESECPECGKDPCECEDKTEEKSEKTETKEFSEEENAPVTDAPATEEVVDEQVSEIADPTPVDEALAETEAEAPVTEDAPVEEVVEPEDAETTNVDEVITEDFSDSESEDEIITNDDVINEVLDENPTDLDAEVEESAPVVQDTITNFSNKTKKNSSYGSWLNRLANHI